MQAAQKPRRPQLTLTILLYALVDVAGMVLLSSGAFWLARGQALLVAGFPSTTVQALGAVIVGLGLMFWAAARILRELIKRPADAASSGPESD